MTMRGLACILLGTVLAAAGCALGPQPDLPSIDGGGERPGVGNPGGGATTGAPCLGGAAGSQSGGAGGEAGGPSGC